jgi:hypothetical protein
VRRGQRRRKTTWATRTPLLDPGGHSRAVNSQPDHLRSNKDNVKKNMPPGAVHPEAMWLFPARAPHALACHTLVQAALMGAELHHPRAGLPPSPGGNVGPSFFLSFFSGPSVHSKTQNKGKGKSQ